MKAPEKARELVNQYYGYSQTQNEAISKVEKIILTSLCQQVDGLYFHLQKGDYDMPLVRSAVRQMKFNQEIAAELQRMAEPS